MESWFVFGASAFTAYGISTVIDKYLMEDSFEPLPTNMQKMFFDGLIVLMLGTIFLSPSFSRTVLFNGVFLGSIYALAGVVYFEMIKEKDVEQAVPIRQASVTLLSFLGAILLFNEAATMSEYGGVLAVAVGVYLLLSSDGFSLPSWDWGYALIACSVGLGVLYWLLVKLFVGSTPPVGLAITMYFVSAFLLALYIRLKTSNTPLSYFSNTNRLLKIGVTSFFGGAGTFLFYLALSTGRGSHVYPLAGIQSFVIFLLATTFLKEPFTRYRGVGLISVVIGVALVSL